MTTTAQNGKSRVTVKTSARWTLNLMDFTKGAVVAALTASITAAVELLQSGNVFTPAALKKIAVTTAIAVAGYLLKNLGTDTKIVQVDKPD